MHTVPLLLRGFLLHSAARLSRKMTANPAYRQSRAGVPAKPTRTTFNVYVKGAEENAGPRLESPPSDSNSEWIRGNVSAFIN
jgi:hypothetical protein